MSRRSSLGVAIIWLATLTAVSSQTARPQSLGKQAPVVLGPIREVALIEEFTAARAKAWKAKSGSNVAYTVQAGYSLPGVATSLLKLYVGRKDGSDTDPGHNWFTLTRDNIPAGSVPANIDGFRFLLGSQTETQWWISVGLVTRSGETYSHVVADHSFPAGRILEYAVPLSEFQSKSGLSLTAGGAADLNGITFTMSSPGTSLYLDRIAAYRREKLRSWLDFTTSHPTNNLFQRTDPVAITFTPGGTVPKRAAGFRYIIRDFFGAVTSRATVRFTRARRYMLRATPRTDGYYEVTAYFVDADGKPLETHSCIRAEGTVPDGLGTFSVLPSTVRENIARFRKLGPNAFFGLHGDFLALADSIGLSWRFGYTGWQALEPVKPDRSTGPAPWARDALATPPMAPYRLHILPFRPNLRDEAPPWARSSSAKPPPFKNWDDYLAMVRDSVRVEKHLYPHMKHRIYGGAWEINLNMSPYVSQQPEYAPSDVAELFRRFRAAVKAEDPDGKVIGPCPSVIDPAWFESVFKAGVLSYLDGIETHGYNEGVFSPEENDFPGKIARLNALVRRYKGRTLPIYCTEAGQPGVLGDQVAYRSQAERMVRAAVILKGEGVRVFLPFYGIDYDRAGYWGFAFNLDVDSPSGPWSTRRISPKPMVNAVAVCAKLLEGSEPTARIHTLGKGVWAYAFKRNGDSITVVWSPGKARRVTFPVAGRQPVEIVDLMGHAARATAAIGSIRFTAGDSPVYIVRNGWDGVPAALRNVSGNVNTPEPREKRRDGRGRQTL